MATFDFFPSIEEIKANSNTLRLTRSRPMRTPSQPTLTGMGMGLRPAHYQAIHHERLPVDWFEIVTENFLNVGGAARRHLEAVRAAYPVAVHGVALSVASVDPLDRDYLRQLAALTDWLEPAVISDHLCWSRHRGVQSHELLPIAYTSETLRHVAARVQTVQEILGHRLYLENPSTYGAFAASDWDEGDFLAELAHRTDCGVLLDVNNLYVNSMNLGLDPEAYLAALVNTPIGYLHVAGHRRFEQVRVDTHDLPITSEVLALLAKVKALWPEVPIMVEWDGEVPPFATVFAELQRAAAVPEDQPSAARIRAHRSRPTTPARPGSQSSQPSWPELADAFWSLAHDTAAASAADGRLALLAGDRPTPRSVGIGIYGEGIPARYVEVAADQYPTLRRWLGGDAFRDLILWSHRFAPPHHPSIKYAASQLAEALAEAPLPATFLPHRSLLIDLARFEWLLEDLYDVANGLPPLPLQTLREVNDDDWEQLRIELIPALRLLVTSHPVANWTSNAVEVPPPLIAPQGPTYYVVYRAQETVTYVEVPAAECHALAAMQSGGTFREACQSAEAELATSADETVATVVAGLGRWFQAGLVTGLQCKKPSR